MRPDQLNALVTKVVVAEADQHMAAVNDSLDGMIERWRELGHDDAVTVCNLSMFLAETVTARFGLSDMLAVAIRRLAK